MQWAEELVVGGTEKDNNTLTRFVVGRPSCSESYNHGQKSWDTFAFLGCFAIHTGPAPPLTPQTLLDACIQNFFEFQGCIGWGEGELQEIFQKAAPFLEGTEKWQKYEYYSTVPRTFVHDCRCPVFPLSQESKRVGDREVGKKGGALPPLPLSHALFCGCHEGFLSSKFQS